MKLTCLANQAYVDLKCAKAPGHICCMASGDERLGGAMYRLESIYRIGFQFGVGLLYTCLSVCL